MVKDTQRLQMLAGFTKQWRHIAGTWQPNDPASFIQPEAFPNDKGIGSVRAPTSGPSDANSLSGTHMFFDNQAWPDHVLRLGVVFRGPWNLLAAANYSVQAGAFSGPVVDRIAAPDPRFGPSTVTLSNGRAVPNPLATTIRFAYATRGDGQLQLPTLQIWNLRVGRNLQLPTGRVEIAMDVFNVTNNDADQTWQFGANQQFSATYGQQSFRQLPRSARLSLRYVF